MSKFKSGDEVLYLDGTETKCGVVSDTDGGSVKIAGDGWVSEDEVQHATATLNPLMRSDEITLRDAFALHLAGGFASGKSAWPTQAEAQGIYQFADMLLAARQEVKP